MSSSDDLTGSVLTPSQRQFLRFGPEEDMTEASQRMTRSRIRKRLGAAMVDFSILVASDHFEIDDISAALSSTVDIEFSPKPTKLVQEAIAVLYLGTVLNTDEPVNVADFEKICESGIERAEIRAGNLPKSIQVTIEREIEGEMEPDEEPELFELPVDKLDQLRLANRISEEEFIAAIVARHNAAPVGEDEVHH